MATPVTYVGPYEEVDVEFRDGDAIRTVRIKHGETLEFPDGVAKNMFKQESNYKAKASKGGDK